MPTTVVTRALELAAECRSMEEVRLKLLREGHIDVAAHIRIASIKRQISNRLMGSAELHGASSE